MDAEPLPSGHLPQLAVDPRQGDFVAALVPPAGTEGGGAVQCGVLVVVAVAGAEGGAILVPAKDSAVVAPHQLVPSVPRCGATIQYNCFA